MFEPIETERLRLRRPLASDLDALVARRNHPEVAKYQDWTLPWPEERARIVLAETREISEPVDDDWWMLTVETLDGGRIVGDLSLKLQWEGRAAEIGYTFAREEWGRGYAHEATSGLVDRLFSDPKLTRISATLHPDNHRSARIVERLGFVHEGHTRLSWWVGDENSDDWLYGTTRADFEAWTARPTGPPDAVMLEEITWDKVRPVIELSTHKSQERMVSPNGVSLAEAHIPEPYDGKPVTPWHRAVMADGELAGFVMLDTAAESGDRPYLWRLMIDRRHQRRGIGRRVIDQVVGLVRSWGHDELDVSYVSGVGSPEPMYLACGFVPTGKIIDGEIEARLDLRTV